MLAAVATSACSPRGRVSGAHGHDRSRSLLIHAPKIEPASPGPLSPDAPPKPSCTQDGAQPCARDDAAEALAAADSRVGSADTPERGVRAAGLVGSAAEGAGGAGAVRSGEAGGAQPDAALASAGERVAVATTIPAQQ